MTNYTEILDTRINALQDLRYKISVFQEILENLERNRSYYEEPERDENGEIVRDENGNTIRIGRKSEDTDSWDAFMYDGYTVAINALEKEISRLLK